MTESLSQLSRLRRVDSRNVWLGEASHFTPWLAQPENLDLLGETVGIELELEAQEKDVGPFRADLLCKDLGTGDWVLVENQRGSSTISRPSTGYSVKESDSSALNDRTAPLQAARQGPIQLSARYAHKR